jgi:hypothetical protein
MGRGLPGDRACNEDVRAGTRGFARGEPIDDRLVPKANGREEDPGEGTLLLGRNGGGSELG